MNKRTPYEEIIAKKAEQQPVPDLADTIWAAVSAGLDQLPPHVEASNNTPVVRPVTPLSSWRLWVYLLGAAALIVVTWWGLQHRNDLPSKRQQPVMPATPSEKKRLNNDSATRHPNSPATNPPDKETPPVIDSAARVDGSIQHNAAPLDFRVRPPRHPSVTIADTSSHAPPKLKKPGEIKGIEDSDYKIVPEKKGSEPR